MRKRIFHVTLDRDEDGAWIVECPSIPDCLSQGKTEEEALENVKDAISLCLEVRVEKGLPQSDGALGEQIDAVQG